MSFAKIKLNKVLYKIQFNVLYMEFFINKFCWKIEPMLSPSWKTGFNDLTSTNNYIRSVRFWEKFRQGTNREQYRTGVHMIIYLNLILYLAAYIRFYSSNVNLSKLSVITTLAGVLLIFSFRRLVMLKEVFMGYNRLICACKM